MSSDVDHSPDNPTARQQHNILISIPRTASNLVTQLLALPSQPCILAHPRDGYFFLPALSARYRNSTFTRPVSGWSAEERTSVDEALAQSTSAWQTWVADAEQQGKGTFVKEHVNWMIRPDVESSFLHSGPATTDPTTNLDSPIADPQNPTAIPPTFWPSVRATFLIRHPALAFPSTLRTALSNEGLSTVLGKESATVMRWECTYRWHAQLYVYLRSLARQSEGVQGARKSGWEPLIIDACQLQDGKFVERYAEAVGLDADLVRTSWSPVAEEERDKLHAIERRMKDTLLASKGVVKSKLASEGIVVEAEKRMWEEEFGKDLARRLERLVEGAMEEYEFLFERRWTGER